MGENCYLARNPMLDRAAIEDIKWPRAQIKATDVVKRRISAENTTYPLAAHRRRNRRGDRQTILLRGAAARVTNIPFPISPWPRPHQRCIRNDNDTCQSTTEPQLDTEPDHEAVC
jgi:hypothetical protein